MRPSSVSGDMLYGVRHIAQHLGVKPRQAHYLVQAGRLPVFREGRIICASRAALNVWLAERAAPKGDGPTPTPEQAALIAALAGGQAVAFWPPEVDPNGQPGFMMRAVSGVFQVRDGQRRAIGTFADFDAAWTAGMATAGAAAT